MSAGSIRTVELERTDRLDFDPSLNPSKFVLWIVAKIDPTDFETTPAKEANHWKRIVWRREEKSARRAEANRDADHGNRQIHSSEAEGKCGKAEIDPSHCQRIVAIVVVMAVLVSIDLNWLRLIGERMHRLLPKLMNYSEELKWRRMKALRHDHDRHDRYDDGVGNHDTELDDVVLGDVGVGALAVVAISNHRRDRCHQQR